MALPNNTTYQTSLTNTSILMKGVQELNYKFLVIKLDDNRDRWVFIKIGSTTLFTLPFIIIEQIKNWILIQSLMGQCCMRAVASVKNAYNQSSHYCYPRSINLVCSCKIMDQNCISCMLIHFQVQDKRLNPTSESMCLKTIVSFLHKE